MYIRIKMNKYNKASSLEENGSLAWITKAAMHIVKIIGSIESLYRNPVMNPIVQNTSANMARQSESLLPIPITLGNEFESMLNPASFCSP